VKIEIEIGDERVMDMLSSAFENRDSIAQWCRVVKYENPRREKPTGKFHGLDIRENKYLWLPLSTHGAVLLQEIDNGAATGDNKKKPMPLRLDRAAIARGLAALLKDVPHQFASFIAENNDMNTADCFVQCCVFGEVKYG
jgi:hypothetical protein